MVVPQRSCSTRRCTEGKFPRGRGEEQSGHWKSEANEPGVGGKRWERPGVAGEEAVEVQSWTTNKGGRLDYRAVKKACLWAYLIVSGLCNKPVFDEAAEELFVDTLRLAQNWLESAALALQDPISVGNTGEFPC